MRRLLATLACTLFASSAAATAPDKTCERVTLSLAPTITPAVVARDWGTGEEHREANAALELRGCHGERLDRMELPAPLATLDPKPLQGTTLPTRLVSADLTAPAGSTSGPLTLPVEIADHHLRVARARGPAGASEEIHLAATGKAAWRGVPAGPTTDLLAVACRHEAGGFVTTWRRYHFDGRQWTIRERRRTGFWESDSDFPEASLFP